MDSRGTEHGFVRGRGSGRAGGRAGRGRRAGGFSMLELVLVVVILIILVTLLFPALSGARNAARRAATTATMADLSSAVGQFRLDHRRNPGHFSPEDMGHQQNENRGFSAMQNVLLDLAGGIVPQNVAGDEIVEVAPHTQNGLEVVRVDIGLIGAPQSRRGATAPQYYAPDSSRFRAQDDDGQQQASVDDHKQLPSLVDDFGSPILAWVANDGWSYDETDADSVFAARNSNTASRANFWWASNAAFLRATSLGRMGEDQTFQPNERRGSLIGQGANNQQYRDSLAGLLGNPAYPDRDLPNTLPSPPPRPHVARGSVVFHSAGTDGKYLGMYDRGARSATSAGDYTLHYWLNFYSANGERYSDNGQFETRDVVSLFDDIIVTAGN